MVFSNNVQRTHCQQIYKLTQQKPSHIMLLIKKGRSKTWTWYFYQLLAVIAWWVAFMQVYVSFMITNLIELGMEKLILNHMIGNNCPEFCNGLPDSYFFKLILRSDCLEVCFWTITFKSSWFSNITKIPVAFKPEL